MTIIERDGNVGCNNVPVINNDAQEIIKNQFEVLNRFSLEYFRVNHNQLYNEWISEYGQAESALTKSYRTIFANCFADSGENIPWAYGKLVTWKSAYHGGIVCVYSDMEKNVPFIYLMRVVPPYDVHHVTVRCCKIPFVTFKDAKNHHPNIMTYFSENVKISEFEVLKKELKRLGIHGSYFATDVFWIDHYSNICYYAKVIECASGNENAKMYVSVETIQDLEPEQLIPRG